MYILLYYIIFRYLKKPFLWIWTNCCSLLVRDTYCINKINLTVKYCTATYSTTLHVQVTERLWSLVNVTVRTVCDYEPANWGDGGGNECHWKPVRRESVWCQCFREISSCATAPRLTLIQRERRPTVADT